jgi:FkbM family methyltransferase
MIVKNESEVILRSLESVRQIVDYALIEDTGSTDGTQGIIRDWLASVALPGEVYDEPWRDFAYNRSHVLARLRKNRDVDYALTLDADDHINFDSHFDVAAFKNTLSHDLYDVQLRGGPARYLRPQISSNRLEFRYRGVLHEFLQAPRARITRGKTAGFYITSTREGARSQDPEKCRKDAAVLEKELKSERDSFFRARYTFYLARSYENAGEKELALKAFVKRATLGHWTEEIFMSLYSAGNLKEQLGGPVEEVIATFARASEVAPTRAEALHAASRVCRANKRFAEGYNFARRGLAIPLPAEGLFVVPWIYDYGLLDEFAVNAYWAERYQDCFDACQRLLCEGKMPAAMRDRVEKNADAARNKIRPHGNGLRANADSATRENSGRIPMDFLFDLLRPERLTAVADIGANPIDSIPPYKPLLDERRCRVFGFEPQPAALAALNSKKGDLETYLPGIVGDGKPGVLRVCRGSGMTSLFAPNQLILRHFPGFCEWGHVVEEIPVMTRRLDDITEIEFLDFLKMDIQGAELSVIQNGPERLKTAVAVQVEVSFIPLYEYQPTFGEIDRELRRLDFLPHSFVAIKSWPTTTLAAKIPDLGATKQLLEADILYVRDFTKPDLMTSEQLKHLAIVAHHCYSSFNLAANCIHNLAGRNAVRASAAQLYIGALKEAGIR